ncbi:hypothetical protein U1Q18_048481 [Sarracenia purpurea var. burkii]
MAAQPSTYLYQVLGQGLKGRFAAITDVGRQNDPHNGQALINLSWKVKSRLWEVWFERSNPGWQPGATNSDDRTSIKTYPSQSLG